MLGAGKRDLFLGMSAEEEALFDVQNHRVLLRNPLSEQQRSRLSEPARALVAMIEDPTQLYVIHPILIEDSAMPRWAQTRILSGVGRTSLRATSTETGGQTYDLNLRYGPGAAAGASAVTLASPERVAASHHACERSSSCATGANLAARPSSGIPGETHIFYSTGASNNRFSALLLSRWPLSDRGVQSMQGRRSGFLWHEVGHAELARRGMPFFHGQTPMLQELMNLVSRFQETARQNGTQRTPRAP